MSTWTESGRDFNRILGEKWRRESKRRGSEKGWKEDWRLEKNEGDRGREIFRWCGEVMAKGRGWEGMGGQEDGKGGKTWQNWIILWGKEDKEKGKEWGVNKRTDGGDTRMLDGACGYYASPHGFCQHKPECVYEKKRDTVCELTARKLITKRQMWVHTLILNLQHIESVYSMRTHSHFWWAYVPVTDLCSHTFCSIL